MKKIIRKLIGIDPDLSGFPEIGQAKVRTVSNCEHMSMELIGYETPTQLKNKLTGTWSKN